MCKELKEKLKPIAANYFGFTEDQRIAKEQYDLLQTKYNTLNTTLEEASLENQSLHELLEQKKKESEIEEAWNNKYPKANIEYTGRTFGTSKNRIPIDVRLLITPQDYHIHNILSKHNLYITDGNYEEGIPKIYNFIRSNFYNYVFDENNYGIPEFWEFPFEILEALEHSLSKGFYCDSWANFIASFYIAAGVPEWKVRVVVGDCALGGHSTNYLHSDVDNKFHHLNSTYGNKALTKISQYPLTDNAGETGTDKLGIYNVWLSFNNKHAWHEFTSSAKKSFNKKGKKLFKITRIKE